MSGNSIDYSVKPLTPYIRLTKKGHNYTLWVMVPLPIGYYLKHNDNPQVIEQKKGDVVLVNIFVEGPQKPGTSEWYAAPLKVKLPSPEDAHIKISGDTPIEVTVYLDDPETEGKAKVKYDDAEGD